MNIQDESGKVFDFTERELSMEANSYFGPRRTNRPHANTKYRPVQ